MNIHVEQWKNDEYCEIYFNKIDYIAQVFVVFYMSDGCLVCA